MLTPKELASETCKIGLAKVTKKNSQVIVSAILAGLFVGFGYYGYIVLTSGSMVDPTNSLLFFGKFLGGMVFPVGIILILIGGGDLFTGNCLITMGCLDKQYKMKLVLKNLMIVFIGNFIGALFFVALIYFSGTIGEGSKVFINKVAFDKVHIPYGQAIFRGILCNIIVAMSVYISYAAKTVSSRIIAVFLPILLFAISGYEHSVANMIILPLSYLLGGNITIQEILWNNLVPVTIGNLIGGAVLIPYAYYYLFLRNHH